MSLVKTYGLCLLCLWVALAMARMDEGRRLFGHHDQFSQPELAGMDLLEHGVGSRNYFLRQDLIEMANDVGGSVVAPGAHNATLNNSTLSNSTLPFDEDEDDGSIKDDASILRSKLDNRKYASLKLKNGLEVLLISDPDTPKAAASMDIGAGYFNDPPEVAGLAHFLEHMLFLGSDKYPKENDFETYITQHGGSNNAYTGMENTNFYLDIFPSDLKGALDRFAQFFIAPRLGLDNAQREMNAVNSEHRKNIENDGWRSTQLKRHVASKTSPYSKFGTGSLETLGKYSMPVLQSHLRNLWNATYTAGNMRLVVLGAHPLSTLSRWVQMYFSGVRPTPEGFVRRDKKVQFPDEHTTVYDGQVVNKIISYSPVRRMHTLTLQWAIPSQAKNYLVNPAAYLGHILEADGPNTLASHLRKKGWITSLSAGSSVTATTFSMFEIDIRLTPKGMDYANEIVEAVFQAIRMIRNNGINRWRYTELNRLSTIQFNWAPKQRPQQLVSDVSARMRWMKKSHWLSGRSHFYKFDKKAIAEVAEFLKPETVTIFKSQQNFTDVTLNMTEPHYGIKYTIQPIPQEALRIWKDETDRAYLFGINRSSAKLKLPAANGWIPTRPALAVKPYYDIPSRSFMTKVNPNATLHVAPPQIILERERPAVRVWFKQDAKYGRPTAHALLRVWVRGLTSSPRAAALTVMYIELVNDILQDWAFAASTAGYDYSIRSDSEGFTISVSGYAENLESYIESITYRLSAKGFRGTEARFAIIRERALEALSNSKFQAPYKYARSLARLALGESHPNSELAVALNSLTLQEVNQWPVAVLSDARLEAFVNGNVYPWEARKYVETAVKTLNYKTISTSFKDAHRHIQSWKSRRPLLDGRYTINTPSLDPHEPNSMVYALYQSGTSDEMDRIYMQILDRYMHKASYNSLRTQEQLGYIVWSQGTNIQNVNELVIQVQSTGYDPIYVDNRIQTFITKFRNGLYDQNPIDTKTFATHVMSLYESKLINATSHAEYAKEAWSAILTQRYNFAQRFIDAQLLLKKANIAGFLKFIDRTFGFGKYSGNSLTFQIYAHAHNASQAQLKPAPAQFGAHTQLPAPLPKSRYTNKLRRVATERLHANFRREGTLSEYLKRSREFRESAEGKKVLTELLRRHRQRAVLRRTVLEHFEQSSITNLAKPFDFNLTAESPFAPNCSKSCEAKKDEDDKGTCVHNCVLTKMVAEREVTINKTRDTCKTQCTNSTAHPTFQGNATLIRSCQTDCDLAATKGTIALRHLAIRAHGLGSHGNYTGLPVYNDPVYVANVTAAHNATNATRIAFMSTMTETKVSAKDLMASPIVRENAPFEEIVRAAFTAGHNNVVDFAKRRRMAKAAEFVSFLEESMELDAEAEAEAEVEVEVDAETEVEAEAEADADIDVEAETLEAEMDAASALRDKNALLAVLEREAFEAALALREQSERVQQAEAIQSLAEAEAVPSQVTMDGEEAAIKKLGLDKFEEVEDPRKEIKMSSAAIKADVRALEERVAKRYANMTDFAPRFQYEGADLDVPISLTIQFSPFMTSKRASSIAMLPYLRHSLGLAPLSVPNEVPAIVVVPEEAPTNATTVALGYFNTTQ